MGSINAQQTALKVSETIAKGKKVKLGEIIKANGYSLETSLNPSIVTNTKSYQKTLKWASEPIINGIQEHINKLKDELSHRNLSQEEYRTLVSSLDIYIKNYQLLTGGATERQILILPSEVIERNDIQITKDKS